MKKFVRAVSSIALIASSTAACTQTVVRLVPTPVVSVLVSVTPTPVPTPTPAPTPVDTGIVGGGGQLLLIIFVAPKGGCVTRDISQRIFSLRSPNGNELRDLGPILELPLGRGHRDSADKCAWDFFVPLRPRDRFFVVADEQNAWRWGPYSYEQMQARGYVLRLRAEDRFSSLGH
jgi:hypothetical protein